MAKAEGDMLMKVLRSAWEWAEKVPMGGKEQIDAMKPSKEVRRSPPDVSAMKDAAAMEAELYELFFASDWKVAKDEPRQFMRMATFRKLVELWELWFKRHAIRRVGDREEVRNWQAFKIYAETMMYLQHNQHGSDQALNQSLYIWAKGGGKAIQYLLFRLGGGVSPSKLAHYIKELVWQHALQLTENLQKADGLVIFFDSFVRQYGVRILAKKVGASQRGNYATVGAKWGFDQRVDKEVSMALLRDADGVVVSPLVHDGHALCTDAERDQMVGVAEALEQSMLDADVDNFSFSEANQHFNINLSKFACFAASAYDTGSTTAHAADGWSKFHGITVLGVETGSLPGVFTILGWVVDRLGNRVEEKYTVVVTDIAIWQYLILDDTQRSLMPLLDFFHFFMKSREWVREEFFDILYGPLAARRSGLAAKDNTPYRSQRLESIITQNNILDVLFILMLHVLSCGLHWRRLCWGRGLRRQLGRLG